MAKTLSGKEKAVLNYLARIDSQIATVKNPQVIGALTDNELEDFYKTLKKFTQEMEHWVSTYKFYKNEQTQAARKAAGMSEALFDIADELAESTGKLPIL